MKKSLFFTIAAVLPLLSCEAIDNDIDRHVDASGQVYVELSEVAGILASVPLQKSHLQEVYTAVSVSSENGYDEEYTMRNLFEAPGSGVGEKPEGKTRAGVQEGEHLRDLIESHVRQTVSKSMPAVAPDPDRYLEALSSSDIQIYWPFNENWDGETMPIITFDPEDGTDANVGYRLFLEDDGSCHVEEVIVDEEMAARLPVWVVNRNSDAEYTTLEMLRREDPDWGAGGGTVIVKPGTKSLGEQGLNTVILKDFTVHRNFDSWFAGASEFFVKTGSLDDFTASTEAELRLFNPMITDFMIVVKRNQIGKPQPFNAVLIPDWNPQMTHTAFMITEDDGGTKTEWKTTALVRVDSKSYGVEISLPLNSRDDVVWRGHLTDRWLEANKGQTGRFGDIDLTFEVVEY